MAFATLKESRGGHTGNRIGACFLFLATVLMTSTAAETLSSGSTLLRNDVGAYPDRDNFRYDVSVFPSQYDSPLVSVPHGMTIRVRLAVVGPRSVFQYLNLSAGEAGIQLIRAYSSSTGRRNECNSTEEIDVLERVTDMNSASGSVGSDRMALEGFTTTTAPSEAFRICYRKSVSRYRNATLEHNSTSAWNSARIPASWRRGSTYKDLWEPLDRTMHFAWQSPHSGSFVRNVNASQVRFSLVSENATVAGHFGAVRLHASANFSSPLRLRSSGDAFAGDVVKLVPTGVPCVQEISHASYPGTFAATTAGVFSNDGFTLASRGAATGVVPVGTESVNWLAGVHTDADATTDHRTAVAYMQFPEIAGRYDICYSSGEERRVWSLSGPTAETQSPGWRKLYSTKNRLVSQIVIRGDQTHRVTWSIDSVDALSWTRVVVTGPQLLGGPVSRGDLARQYTLQLSADAVRLVPATEFNVADSAARGCWYRALENMTRSPGDSGNFASYDLRSIPTDESKYPIAPWNAPQTYPSERLAAYLRVPRLMHPSRVCYRRPGGFWFALPLVLRPRPPAINVSWTLSDRRSGTSAQFHLHAATPVLSAGRSDYAVAGTTTVWARIVASDDDCQLGRPMVDSPGAATTRPGASTGLTAVTFVAPVPFASSSPTGKFRLCARIGAGAWHALEQELEPTSHMVPTAASPDPTAGASVRVVMTLGVSTNLSAATIRMVPNSTNCFDGLAVIAEGPAGVVCGSPLITNAGTCAVPPSEGSHVVTAARPREVASAGSLIGAVLPVPAAAAGSFASVCFRSSVSRNWEPSGLLRIKRPPAITINIEPAGAQTSGETVNVTVSSPTAPLNASLGASRLRFETTDTSCLASENSLRGTDSAMWGFEGGGEALALSTVVNLPAVHTTTTLTLCARVAASSAIPDDVAWRAVGTVVVSPSIGRAVAERPILIPNANWTTHVIAGHPQFTVNDEAWLESASRPCTVAANRSTSMQRTHDFSAGDESDAFWRIEVPALSWTEARLCYRFAALSRVVSVPIEYKGQARTAIIVAVAPVSEIEFDASLFAADAPAALLAGAETGPNKLSIRGNSLDPAKDTFKLVATATIEGSTTVPRFVSCEAPARGASSKMMTGNASLVFATVSLPLRPGRYVACYWWSRQRAWLRAAQGELLIVSSQLSASIDGNNVTVTAVGSTSDANRLNSICGRDCSTFSTRVRFVNSSTACSNVNTVSWGFSTVDVPITWPLGVLSDNGWFTIPSLPAGDYSVCILRAAAGVRDTNAAWIVARVNGTDVIRSRPSETVTSVLAVVSGHANFNSTVAVSRPFSLTVGVDLAVSGILSPSLEVDTPVAVALSFVGNGAVVRARVSAAGGVCNVNFPVTSNSLAVSPFPLRLTDGFAAVKVVFEEACTHPCSVSVDPIGLSATIPATKSAQAVAVQPVLPVDSSGFLIGTGGGVVATLSKPLSFVLAATDTAGIPVPTANFQAHVEFAVDFAALSRVECVTGCATSGSLGIDIDLTNGNAEPSVRFVETRRFAYGGSATTVVATITGYGIHARAFKVRILPGTPTQIVLADLAEVSASGQSATLPAFSLSSPSNSRARAAPATEVLWLGQYLRATVAPLTAAGVAASDAAVVADAIVASISDGGVLVRAGATGEALGAQGASQGTFVIDFAVKTPCSVQPCVITFQSSVFRFFTTFTVYVSDRPPFSMKAPRGVRSCEVNSTGAKQFDVLVVGAEGHVATAANGTLRAFARSRSNAAVQVGAQHAVYRVSRGSATVTGLCLARPCDSCPVGLVTDAGVTGELTLSASLATMAIVLRQASNSSTIAGVPMPFTLDVVSADGTIVHGAMLEQVTAWCSAPGGRTCEVSAVAWQTRPRTSLLLTFAEECSSCMLMVSGFVSGQGVAGNVTTTVHASSTTSFPDVLELTSVNLTTTGGSLPFSVTVGAGVPEPSTVRGLFEVECGVELAHGADARVFGSGGTLSPSTFTVTNQRFSSAFSLSHPCLHCVVTCWLRSNPNVNASVSVTVEPVPARIVVEGVMPPSFEPYSGGVVHSGAPPQVWNINAYAVDAHGLWAYNFAPALATLTSTLPTMIVDGRLAVETGSLWRLQWRAWSSDTVPLSGPTPSVAIRLGFAQPGISQIRITADGVLGFVSNQTNVTDALEASVLNVSLCTDDGSVLSVEETFVAVLNERLTSSEWRKRPIGKCASGSFLVGETAAVDVSILDASGQSRNVVAPSTISVASAPWSHSLCGRPSVSTGQTVMKSGRAIVPVTFTSVCSGCQLDAVASPCGSGSCTARTERFTVALPAAAATQRVVVTRTALTDDLTAGSGYSVTLVHHLESPSGALLETSVLPRTHTSGIPELVVRVEMLLLETVAAHSTRPMFEVSIDNRRTIGNAREFNLSPAAPVKTMTLFVRDPCVRCAFTISARVAGTIIQQGVLPTDTGADAFAVHARATRIRIDPSMQSVGVSERFAVVATAVDDSGRPATLESTMLANWSRPTFEGSNDGACGVVFDHTPGLSPDSFFLGPRRPSADALLSWTNPGTACTLRTTSRLLSTAAEASVFGDAVAMFVNSTVTSVTAGVPIRIMVHGTTADGSISATFANATTTLTVTFSRPTPPHVPSAHFMDSTLSSRIVDRLADGLVVEVDLPGAYPSSALSLQATIQARNGSLVTISATTAFKLTVSPPSCTQRRLLQPLPQRVYVRNPFEVRVAAVDSVGRGCPLVAEDVTVASNCSWGSNGPIASTRMVDGLAVVSFEPPSLPRAAALTRVVLRNVTVPNCTNGSFPLSSTSSMAPTAGTSNDSSPPSSSPTAASCIVQRNVTEVIDAEPRAASICRFDIRVGSNDSARVIATATTPVSFADATRLAASEFLGIVAEAGTATISAVNHEHAIAANFSASIAVVVNTSNCTAFGVLRPGESVPLIFHQGIASFPLRGLVEGECNASIQYQLHANASRFSIRLRFAMPSALVVRHSPVVTGRWSSVHVDVISASGHIVDWLGPTTVEFAAVNGSQCVLLSGPSRSAAVTGVATFNLSALRLPNGWPCAALPFDYASSRSGPVSYAARVVASLHASAGLLPRSDVNLRVEFGFASVVFRKELPMGSWRIGFPFNGTFFAADNLGNTAPLPAPSALMVSVAANRGQIGPSTFLSTSMPGLVTWSSEPQLFVGVYNGSTASVTLQARWAGLRSFRQVTYFQHVAGLRVTASTLGENMTVGDVLNVTVAVVDDLGLIVSLDNSSIIVAREPFGVRLLGGPLAVQVTSGVAHFSWRATSLVPLLTSVRFLLAGLEAASPQFAVLYTPAPREFVYVPRPLALVIGRYRNASVFDVGHYINVVSSITLLRPSRNETIVQQLCEPVSGMLTWCFASSAEAMAWHRSQTPQPVGNVTGNISNFTWRSTATTAPVSTGRRLQQASTTTVTETGGVDVHFEMRPDYQSGLDAFTAAERGIENLRIALANPDHPIHAELQPLSPLRDLSGASFPPLPPPTTMSTGNFTPPPPTRYAVVEIDGAPTCSVVVALILSFWVSTLAV